MRASTIELKATPVSSWFGSFESRTSGTAELSQSVAGKLPSGAVVLKVHDTGAVIGEPAASFAVVTVAVYAVMAASAVDGVNVAVRVGAS